MLSCYAAVMASVVAACSRRMLGRRALIHKRQNGIGCDESTVLSIRQLLEAPMPVLPVGERVIDARQCRAGY